MLQGTRTIYLNTTQNETFESVDIDNEFFQELSELDFGYDTRVTPISLVYISAVRRGSKPGCTFSDPEPTEDPTESDVYELLERYSIPARVYILERNQETHAIYFLWSDDTLVNQLDDIDESYGSFRDWEDKNNPDWARFLGVPEKDIEWWEEEGYDSLGDLFEDRNEKLIVESNRVHYHRELLHFTPYIGQLTESGLMRRIEHGRDYVEAYKQVCEENNISYSINGVWTGRRNWDVQPEY